jgi:hypothetical protein
MLKMTKQDNLQRMLEKYIVAQQKAFTIDDCMEKMNGAGKAQYTAKDIKDVLDDLRMTFTKDNKTFTPRSVYFKKVEFIIEPTGDEIRQGYLIPGHHCAPFFNDDAVFPWECTLITEDKKEVPKTTTQIDIKDLLIYYTLIGVTNIPFYLEEDQESNEDCCESLEKNLESIMVHITVFDFTFLFEKWNFKKGDVLQLVTKDWHSGTFFIKHIRSDEKSKLCDDAEKWKNNLDKAFEKVFSTLGVYAPVEDQVAWAYYYAGKTALKNAPMSLGAYITESKKVFLVPFGGDAKLWRSEKLDLQLQKNKPKPKPKDSDSFDSLLESLDFPFPEIVVESYLLDELFASNGNLLEFEESADAAFKRLIDLSGVVFSSEQELKKFAKHLEKLFNETGDNYSFFDDQKRGPLRSRALDILDRYYQWLLTLDDDSDPEVMPEQEMLGAAQTVMSLVNIIDMINYEDERKFTGKEMVAMIDNLEGNLNMFLQKINDAVRVKPKSKKSNIKLVKKGEK